ncbi:O-antigen ligase family protein [Candidatus Microgenomates bacterium]|nr:O-antigen ligase family protein [Candidatus Microgenomates bacterium]
MILDKIIEWCFYLLFFLVPLWFYAGSSELFEYNKMMLTYGLTIVIVAAWALKCLAAKKLLWRKTFLDIPLFLYFGTHVLSTIFSIDPHVSVWGYYSRFHEGLLATTSYLLLYFAAVSNLQRLQVLRILLVSFISGAIVSVYGALEHFGASPSCLIITGRFDVDCWVQDVKNRVFATLGQPNWMAAYLDIVLLTSLGFLQRAKKGSSFFWALIFAAILFTKSRSGLLGLGVGLAVFGLFELKSLKNYWKIAVAGAVIVILFGLPFAQTEKFSLENLLTQKPSTVNSEPAPAVNPGYIDIGVSESGDIRKVVWSGALKVWQRYPIFGSGVETFAYAYYLDRPAAHNLLSEWDFLYNKAHNEFLNILATTGTVGMLAYLGLIGTSIWLLRKNPSLLAAYVSILVTNFWGFSVVIIGLFFFLLPAFSFILTAPETEPAPAGKPGWLPIGLIGLISLIGLIGLVNMWQADKAYAYGKNLDSINRYVQGYDYLKKAVDQNPNEPVFRDELSANEAILAAASYSSATDSAKQLAAAAIADSNLVVSAEENSMPFWKTRTRVFYSLGTIDPKYYFDALAAIQKAQALAPTDAKVHYNLGILLGRTGQISFAIKVFEETIALKPDYRDAYYALALYQEQSGDHAAAKKSMQTIISKIGPDKEAIKWLDEHP